MKAWFITGLSLLLMACVSTPPARLTSSPLFADELFPEPPPADLQADVFALSPAMRDYLATTVAARIHKTGARMGLFEVMRDELRIQYDASLTRSAAQAFETRSGNCLSLVILTAAFAREMGIPVRYQSVYGNDSWSRSNGLAFLSGHVNITLGPRPANTLTGSDNGMALTIDFLAPEQGQVFHSQSLEERTLVAMYRNNRAAEALAAGQHNAAYWWAREAIRSAPDYLTAYNTLGVIYRRHGQPLRAEAALRQALVREPGNALVLSNLAEVLADLGRSDEAAQLRRQLASNTPFPPFHYFDLGLLALRKGDYPQAREQFRKELSRTPYDPELLFALGLANLQLGDLRQARKYVGQALENSTTLQSQGIYAAKLEHIKTLQRQSTLRGGS